MIVGLKNLIIELMDKIKKCYSKLFKVCLTLEKKKVNAKSKKPKKSR